MAKSSDLFKPAPPVAKAEPQVIKAEEFSYETEHAKISEVISSIAGQAIKEEEPVNNIVVESKTVDVIDLNDLDETTLAKYPITGKSLNDAPMAVLKPKDPSLALHWVYYDRSAVGQGVKISANNLSRYKFWGFQFATVDDIEGGSDAIAEGMINEGEMITNYDTVLMKINKIRLMSHYKKNLEKSLANVERFSQQAVRVAEGETASDPSYAKARATHPKADIEFYSTVK